MLFSVVPRHDELEFLIFCFEGSELVPKKFKYFDNHLPIGAARQGADEIIPAGSAKVKFCPGLLSKLFCVGAGNMFLIHWTR